MAILTYTNYETYFSSQRLQRYLVVYAGDTDKAIQLYKANLRIAQAFHPLLCLFEVILRNQINSELSAYFRDNDWILNQRTGFMSNPALRRGYYFLRTEVNKTEARIIRQGFTASTGKVIADLNFGFWTALFMPHHFSILRRRLIRIFTNLPATIGSSDIYTNLYLIKEFRNRINHNEPICFHLNSIDFTISVQVYKAVRRTVKWINPDLLPLFKEFDSVLDEILEAKKI
jgi:hypothetical protein